MSKWIRKKDQVLVIAGNDKGKVGEVLRRQDDYVLIQGVNIKKKHMKSKQQGQPSRIIEIEMPIHISNVRLSTSSGEPIKVKVKTLKTGSKKLVSLEGDKEKTFRELRKRKGK